MRELNDHDVEMFYTMTRLKHLSRCLDKQVVCLITDANYNILSIGVNTIEACDQNCEDKEKRICVVKHAEAVAVENLSALNRQRSMYAYVSLFPCVTCQEVLEPCVDEIVTFGMVHKEWISDKVVVFPHISYKLLEVMGQSAVIPMGVLSDAPVELLLSIDAPYYAVKDVQDEVLDDARAILKHRQDREQYALVRKARLPYIRCLLHKLGVSPAAKV